jgi:hypothetical protein
MPAELIKQRTQDVLRRLGCENLASRNLLIFGRDIEDAARRILPSLPPFSPLNTENGRLFLLALIEAVGGVDLMIFDNVMSLIVGDMKDEVSWSETLPLVTTLTDRRIGQLWLDHTGHNSDRQYGTSTKAWRFDAVGGMTPITDGCNDPTVTAFKLSFDYPGKARRRTPDNWHDFAARTIRLADDVWTSEPVARPNGNRPPSKVTPAAEEQYRALLDALAISPTPGRTTRDAWYAECVRLGLTDKLPADVDSRERDRKTKTFRTYISALKVAGRIGVNGDEIIALRREQQ